MDELDDDGSIDPSWAASTVGAGAELGDVGLDVLDALAAIDVFDALGALVQPATSPSTAKPASARTDRRSIH